MTTLGNLTTAGELASKSDSVLLISIVILAIVMLFVVVPTIKAMAQINQTKREQELQREDKILTVIQNNTEIYASLKTIMLADQKFCSECRADQLALWKELRLEHHSIRETLDDIKEAL